MIEKVKISAVSYINTLPFIYGIETGEFLKDKIDLSKDIPSVCAEKLISNEVDIGLIPVAEINNIQSARIISNYCIGAVGKVNSVLLLSDVPLKEIKYIYLDYQSRTSVNLVKILAKNHWKIRPQFIQSKSGYEMSIRGSAAGLIIGDRCFKYSDKFPYVYDLSNEWLSFTSLPFVFAAWVSNKAHDEKFITLFNSALQFGLERKNIAADIYSKEHPGLSVDIRSYLNNDISYSLDQEKKKGMELFLKMLKSI